MRTRGICIFLSLLMLGSVLIFTPSSEQSNATLEEPFIPAFELNEAQETALADTGFGRGATANWSASGGSEGRDFIYEIVEDSGGNIIIAGSVYVDCWLGSVVVHTEGLGDIIVAKLDPDGNWLWAKSAGTAIAYDEARGVALDDDDDIYITGYLNGTVTFGSTQLVSDKFDGYIAKLNGTNGNWEYAIKYGGFDVDVGWDIVVDSAENVYVTGYYQNFSSFGIHNLNGGTPSDDYRFFIAKYNHSTPDWEWAFTAIGDALSVGFQLVLDASENVYIVGYNTGSVTWNNNFTSSTSGTYNGFLVKYSSSGSFQWGRAIGAASGCFGTNCGVYFNNVVIDSQQRVVVGGNQLGDVTYAGKSYTGLGNWDIVVSRWQADGIHDWYSMTGSGGDDRVQALAVNPDDRPVVGGWLGGSSQFGSTILSNISGDTDFFMAQLYANGQWDWAHKMGGSGDDTTHALHVLSDGTYVAGGSFSGVIDFDGIPRSATDEDIWIWKFRWDTDDDGVHDFTDNCVKITNLNQSNHDGDVEGDACETDDDNDGKHDAIDNCQYGEIGWNSSDTALDYDSDGCRDDSEDLDDDGDGILDIDDDCPKGMTSWISDNQTDIDNDGCRDLDEDLDDDQDLVDDDVDNCPTDYNPQQENWDGDNFGDKCDFDDDGDSVNDDVDDCPMNETGWTSNSQSDNDGDGCKDDIEDDDDDNDGMLDDVDQCPSGVTGWTAGPTLDHDADGCQNDGEDSDNDNDGVLNEFDTCPNGELNWIRDGSSDQDSDGCRDATEDPNDDNDFYMDIEDDCPTVEGTAYLGGLRGCPDFDEDGWGDTADAFPQDSSQWEDGDQDGYGDNPTGSNADDCPLVAGNSTSDRLGCIDSDEDTYSDPDAGWTVDDGADALPDEPSQWIDGDKDGYGDDPFGFQGDLCPGYKGFSHADRMGCPDSDGDGYSDSGSFGGLSWGIENGADNFPSIPSQWNDSDLDGYGDNWANVLWNDSRNKEWPGMWVKDAKKVDECPVHEGFAGQHQGCPEGMIGIDIPEEEDNQSMIQESNKGGGSTLLYVAGGIAALVAIGLIVAVVILMKKPEPKNRRPTLNEEEAVEEAVEENAIEEGPKTVSSWENLPGGGEYLPVDENGTNWYREANGANWYQSEDGSWTQYQ